MTSLTDPRIIEFVEQVEAHYPASANHACALQNRKYYDDLCQAMQSPLPQNIVFQDTFVNAKTPIREIPIRTYTPDNITTENVILFFHGGGFVVGGLDSHHDICADISSLTGAKIVAVNYRLLPENKTPAALDDCYHIYKWLRSSKVQALVMGDSAGGCLAASLCRRLLNKGEQQPLGQVLIYPVLGLVGAHGNSFKEQENAPLLGTADCKQYEKLYIDGAKLDGELLALHEDNFETLAPAIIVSADIDPLRDDAGEYAKRLSAHGVPVIYRNEKQLVHSFLRARATSDRARSSFQFICQQTAKLLS